MQKPKKRETCNDHFNERNVQKVISCVSKVDNFKMDILDSPTKMIIRSTESIMNV